MAKITIEYTVDDSKVAALLPYLASIANSESIEEIPASPALLTASAITNSSTRNRGYAIFERRAIENGLTVRRSHNSEAGDFIVTTDSTARPVRLVCSESPRISLKRESSQPANLVLTYLWVLSESNNRIFLMTYADAAAILGNALKTDSFITNGYYTSKCSRNHQRMMNSYEDRWEIFR